MNEMQRYSAKSEAVGLGSTLSGLILFGICVLGMFAWDLAAVTRWTDDVTARQKVLRHRLTMLRGLFGQSASEIR